MNDADDDGATLTGTWSADAGPDEPIRAEGDAARYRDLGEIARGGMGRVHRVHDRALGRPLAMKIMDWRLFDDAAARARFLREVAISARLQHPGVVPVQDVGALPDGRLWFTMKEVDGRTFGALIDDVHAASTPDGWGETADGWSLRRLVEALLRVAQTLAYAHRERVVHRDIKPDNLMIGAFGEVMVMDWGIARRLDRDPPRDTDPVALVPGTSVVGTPSYMAPEQARGEVPTPAVDVYALGGVLYHLLSGHRPLATGGSPFAVLYRRPRPLVARDRLGTEALRAASADDSDTDPDALAPDAMAPDAIAPDAIAPDAIAPDAMAPDAMAPDAMAPDAMAPDLVTQDAITPDALAPDAISHVAAPDAMARDAIDPDATDAPDPEATDAADDIDDIDDLARLIGVDGTDDLDALDLDPTEPPAEAAPPGPPLPAALVALCHAALEPDPARRPDIESFAAGLRRWLDGEVRRDRARALVADAHALRPQITALRAEATALDHDADALLADVPLHAPLDRKTPAWRLADDARARRRAAREAELTLVQTLRQALEADPDAVDARAMLTAHYRDRLVDAEQRRDVEAAADAAAQLRLHDPVGSAAWLRGDGALTLVTDPPGAAVELFRVEARDRRHVPVRVGPLPPTPLVAHPLAPGSYLLVLRAPGRAPVRYPVRIGRGEHWHGVPPGATETHAIPLPLADAIGPDHIYVPPGWSVLGGDPDATDPLPRQRVWLDGYVIARHPTTNAEYIAFLDALVAAGREADALRWAPAGRSADDSAYGRRPDGRFVLREMVGFVWRPDHPVYRLAWSAADAYARWRAARDGLGWRLPEDLWIERAARGVDERRYAMGDHLDPSFACVVESHPGPPTVASIDAHPLDESIYGVRGLTGNVRAFCSTAYRRGGAPIVDGRPDFTDPDAVTHRVVRGGAYVTQRSWCNAASRFALPPDLPSSNVGVRLCRPWPG